MTVYQPGQRIVLVHTSDPHTRLRPGDTGTVRHHREQTRTVEVDWDSGSRLSMCLDAGDRIDLLDQPTPAPDGASPDAGAWTATLDRLRAAGADAGRGVAEWWAQDTIGGRATGDARATARRILAGIADGAPAVLDALPTFTPPPRWPDGRDTAEVRYLEAAKRATPPWHELTDDQRAETIAASRDAFDTAVIDRVTELCQLAASPTGADLSHLHPDRVRLGGAGVFSGDWARTVGADRYDVGYVGTLVDTWNGWAVFSCTREVAEAIVADQQRHRRALRDSFRAGGVAEHDLDRRVDAELAELRFDGEVIIADQRTLHDDPEAIERISPDADGRYVVMGWNWCWEAVDPYACDRIAGDPPQPCGQQCYTVLTHTDLLVPHDRLRVTALRHTPTRRGVAFTATLALDGQPVGQIRNDGNGGATTLHRPAPGFDTELAVYTAGCRHCGRPVTQEQVLEALVTEYDLDQILRAAAAGGGTVARLLDAGGNILDLQQVLPAPQSTARDALAGHLYRDHPHPDGRGWQLWDGTAWRDLADATAADPEPGRRTGPGAAAPPPLTRNPPFRR